MPSNRASRDRRKRPVIYLRLQNPARPWPHWLGVPLLISQRADGSLPDNLNQALPQRSIHWGACLHRFDRTSVPPPSPRDRSTGCYRIALRRITPPYKPHMPRMSAQKVACFSQAGAAWFFPLRLRRLMRFSGYALGNRRFTAAGVEAWHRPTQSPR
jgi:hypothetical protein